MANDAVAISRQMSTLRTKNLRSISSILAFKPKYKIERNSLPLVYFLKQVIQRNRIGFSAGVHGLVNVFSCVIKFHELLLGDTRCLKYQYQV